VIYNFLQGLQDTYRLGWTRQWVGVRKKFTYRSSVGKHFGTPERKSDKVKPNLVLRTELNCLERGFVLAVMNLPVIFPKS